MPQKRKTNRKPKKTKRVTKRYVKKIVRGHIETQRRHFAYDPEAVKTTDAFKIYGQDAQKLVQDATIDGMKGHKIMASGLKSIFQFKNQTATPVTVMLKLVWVKHGKVLDIGNYSNVLEQNSGDTAPNGDLLDLYRPFDKELFKTIKTYRFSLGGNVDSSEFGRPQTKIIQHWAPIKNAVYTFNGSNITPHTGFLAYYVMVRDPNGTQADTKLINLTSMHTFYYKDM